MMAPELLLAVPVGDHESVVAEMEEAERQEGWLARCEEAGRYLALNAPLVEALALELRSLGEERVLEVGAGDGSLATALRARGVRVAATDAKRPPYVRSRVEALPAVEALRRHRAPVVLGSFIPFDSGVDSHVLRSSHVRHYIVLDARLGGELGSRELWSHPGWTRTPLDEVSRWMITRHDVWLGAGRPLVLHGEAWRLSRVEPTPGGS